MTMTAPTFVPDAEVDVAPVPTTATPSPRVPSGRVGVTTIGLVGFGRTGREVARFLLNEPETHLEWVVRRSAETDHRSASALLGMSDDATDQMHSLETDLSDLMQKRRVDAIIDFSSEEGIAHYGEAAAAEGIPIVTAVSQYSELQQRRLQQLSERTAVLWSPNITLGINFLLLAAQTLKRIAPGADVQIVEEHFRGKKETSGTALRLATALQAPDDAVHSIRAGGIIGVHEVMFGFPAQTVRLRHEAVTRDAFGHGALFAARHLVARQPGLYRMEDLLEPYFVTGIAPDPFAEPGAGGSLRSRVSNGLHALARRLA